MLYRYLPLYQKRINPPAVIYPDDTTEYGNLTYGQQSRDLRYVALFYEKPTPAPATKAVVVYDLMDIQGDGLPKKYTIPMGAYGGALGFAFDSHNTLYVNYTAGTGSTSAGQNYISWHTNNNFSSSPIANQSSTQVIAYQSWSHYFAINGPIGSDYSIRFSRASANGFLSTIQKVDRNGSITTVIDSTVCPMLGTYAPVGTYAQNIKRLAMDFLSPDRAVLNLAFNTNQGYVDKTYLFNTTTTPYAIVYETPNDVHLGSTDSFIKTLSPDRFCIISNNNSGSIIKYFSATQNSFSELPVKGGPPNSTGGRLQSASVVGPNKDHLHILLNNGGVNRREALYKINRDSLDLVMLNGSVVGTGHASGDAFGYLTFPMTDGRLFIIRNRKKVNNYYFNSAAIADLSSVL